MTTGYYLLDNPNPNAPHRGTGHRYHGHTTRNGNARPRAIVCHTTESAYTSGPAAVAGYAARADRPVSYHTVGGPTGLIRLLPTTSTAFHARGNNTHTLGYAFATYAANWPNLPAEIVTGFLDVAGRELAEWCTQYDIEPRKITRAQYDDGATGLISHAELDPTRRTDPGPLFPWAELEAAIRRYLAPPPDLVDPTLPTPLLLIDRTIDPITGGEWWLIDDGGIANIAGAPYYGHLLDPTTLAILEESFGIPAHEFAYTGNPRAIRAEDNGYAIYTDTGHRYAFNANTIR